MRPLTKKPPLNAIRTKISQLSKHHEIHITNLMHGNISNRRIRRGRLGMVLMTIIGRSLRRLLSIPKIQGEKVGFEFHFISCLGFGLELLLTRSTGVQNYKLMISSTVPRPIALVSTISADGKSSNLAPFSYFQNVCDDVRGPSP